MCVKCQILFIGKGNYVTMSSVETSQCRTAINMNILEKKCCFFKVHMYLFVTSVRSSRYRLQAGQHHLYLLVDMV